MTRQIRRWLLRGTSRGPIVVALVFYATSPLVAGAYDPIEVLVTGRHFFEHSWVPGQPAALGGDGLGPVQNDVSCVACHQLGAIGGAGPLEKNVTAMTIAPPARPMNAERVAEAVAKVHVGFIKDEFSLHSNIILHKFSIDPRYQVWRDSMAGQDIPLDNIARAAGQWRHAVAPVRRIVHPSGVSFWLSQRNTPALFGAGIIDQIPDVAILQLEAQQAREGIVSGRVGPVDNVKVGRFGWRGQTAHLRDFVLDACALEVGLNVPTRHQSKNPLNPKYQPAGFDMTADQVETLIQFVGMLPAPQRIVPTESHEAYDVNEGYDLFAKAGCATCHVESFRVSQGKNVASLADGIYSDLLLHDMGPLLADPVTAQPKVIATTLSGPVIPLVDTPSEDPAPPPPPPVTAGRSGSAGGSYYGGGSSFAANSRTPNSTTTSSGTHIITQTLDTSQAQEWKTTPLWGVRDSAPYLHDGRAESLLEAILCHGGEAKFSVAAFLSLPIEQREAILSFLETLVAPDGPSPHVEVAAKD